MSTKHTPGPWRFSSHPHDGNYMRIHCSSDHSEGDNLRGYCSEANARLISAAPDLLEALQRLIATGLHEREYREIMSNPAHYARAAIAKATGEQA